MTDRDMFAAAALTGYLANENTDDSMTIEAAAADAYRYADAMLRERGKAVRDNCVTDNNPEIRCPQPLLTDEEREAIATAVAYLKEDDDFPGIADDRATLRSLLERLA